MKADAQQIARAKYEAEQARKRLATTAAALKRRLKPGTLASNAWGGVREKGTELADDAVQAVKERPAAASGIVAAAVLFLAREPLWAAGKRLFSKRDDEGLVTTRIDTKRENLDLTTPVVVRTADEGVNA